MCEPRWPSSSIRSSPLPSSSCSGAMVSAVRRSPTSNTSCSASSTAAFDVLGHRVADVGDLPGHADEPAQQRVLLDDVGVVPRVGDRRRVGLQRDEDRRVADLLEHPGALELVGHGHRVDGLAPLHEGPDGPEDVPVRRLVEVARRAPLDPDRRRVVRQQHGPEQRLLGLEVVRRHPRAARTGAGPLGAAGGGCRRRLGPRLPYSDGPELGNVRANLLWVTPPCVWVTVGVSPTPVWISRVRTVGPGSLRVGHAPSPSPRHDGHARCDSGADPLRPADQVAALTSTVTTAVDVAEQLDRSPRRCPSP